MAAASSSASAWAAEIGHGEERESRAVWVSVSAECGHMTGGLGLMLDDSPFQASGRKVPPAGCLY